MITIYGKPCQPVYLIVCSNIIPSIFGFSQKPISSALGPRKLWKVCGVAFSGRIMGKPNLGTQVAMPAAAWWHWSGSCEAGLKEHLEETTDVPIKCGTFLYFFVQEAAGRGDLPPSPERSAGMKIGIGPKWTWPLGRALPMPKDSREMLWEMEVVHRFQKSVAAVPTFSDKHDKQPSLAWVFCLCSLCTTESIVQIWGVPKIWVPQNERFRVENPI